MRLKFRVFVAALAFGTLVAPGAQEIAPGVAAAASAPASSVSSPPAPSGTLPPTNNVAVLSVGAVSPVEKASYLRSINPQLEESFALNLALLYDEESAIEGVNADVAFAQMILETAALRFGGQVKREQNNFSGLGAVDGGAVGLSFSSPREGIRAQIQHLKYYASKLPLSEVPANPRLGYIVRGSAPTVLELSKRWASDVDYGKKIVQILERMTLYAEKLRVQPRERFSFGIDRTSAPFVGGPVPDVAPAPLSLD